MKCKKLIGTVVLGILTCMPSTVYAREKKDSLVLNKVYAYYHDHIDQVQKLEDNVYTKVRFNVEKRNFILKCIPSMHTLTKGNREYIRESYNKVIFKDSHNFKINNQLLAGTTRRNRLSMPTLLDLLTPNIYDNAIYEGHMLSPFSKYNRRYYKFTQSRQQDGTTRLDFKPRIYNTQLLNGYAIIDTASGRILKTILNGEYDMITFRTEVQQGDSLPYGLMPDRCTTAATFRFAGNRISTIFDATYNCRTSLPDSIKKQSDREMMDSIRPVPLSETDKRIYEDYDLRQQKRDTTQKHKDNLFKKIFWDTIGDNLVTPIKAESGPAYIRLSPIINPLYIRWSHRHGFSYKMKLRTRYTFSPNRYLTLNPKFGYNFKIKQFYFTAPLRMTYNPKRNGYAEIAYGNGNRISNNSVQRVINESYQDTINFTGTDADKFNDNHLRAFNYIMIQQWLDLETGFICHWRHAVNKKLMREYHMPVEYRSFAPYIGLKIHPWREKGPMLSIDWERGLPRKENAPDIQTLDYERWEFDTQWKLPLPGLQVLNMRLGSGVYTMKSHNYFLDYANFRDENLPGGWEDEWSGNFELLRRSAYNASNYYIRSNVSYDSPLLLATRIPYLGKFIERERFYLGSALMQHSRPYFEVGYSFTNRYVSLGFFASFKNTDFQRVGIDFEYELFRKW